MHYVQSLKNNFTCNQEYGFCYLKFKLYHLTNAEPTKFATNRARMLTAF